MIVDEWQVTIGLSTVRELDDSSSDILIEELKDYGAAIGGTIGEDPSVFATLTIEDDDILDATMRAFRLVADAVDKTNLQWETWIEVAARPMPEDEFEGDDGE